MSANTAPNETLNPDLNPLEIDLLTDSKPDGPRGIEATNPVKKPEQIAFNIENNENIQFSLIMHLYIIIE